jgi:hypothetical protein
MSTSDIQNVLKRHKAFWNMEDVDKPLLRITRYSDTGFGQPREPMQLPLADGTMASEPVFYLKPDMLSPERLSPRHERPSAVPATAGDVFPVRAPYTKVPWMEAIIGCPIRVSLQSSSMWSEPALNENWHKCYDSLKITEIWKKKLLEFTKYLSSGSGNSYLVSNTLMRGPSDMVDALIGEQKLCVGIYQRPEEIKALMMKCAEIFIDIAKAQLDIIPPFHGGYCNLFGIWAPGTSIRTQDDASALVSQ